MLHNKTILITGVGAPGIMGTRFSMIDPNYMLRFIGTDMDPDAVGKHVVDYFYEVNPATESEYLDQLDEICDIYNVDVVVPQNTVELLPLSYFRSKLEARGTNIMLETQPKIAMTNSKINMTGAAHNLGIPTPETYVVKNIDELWDAFHRVATDNGVSKAMIKLPDSNGSRGVRVMEVGHSPADQFFNKPHRMTMGSFEVERLYEAHPRLTLIVQEYLPGREYTVDVLLHDRVSMAIPRLRKRIMSGITFHGEVVRHDELIENCMKLSSRIGFNYVHGYQFKEDGDGVPRLLECNPRVQGTMVLTMHAGWNIIWDSVRIAMGHEPEGYKKIKWGTTVKRYWGALVVDDYKRPDIVI